MPRDEEGRWVKLVRGVFFPFLSSSIMLGRTKDGDGVKRLDMSGFLASFPPE